MRKFNYRVTVNISGTDLKLGFRSKLPDDAVGKRIRVQAIFVQRSVERRFPMDVIIREEETGPYIYADAMVELPYVFVTSPKRKVNVIFAVWIGMEENLVNDQPFPIQKELFARNEKQISRNIGKFILGTVGLPFIIGKNYLANKDKKAAIKEANAQVYEFSGYNYSPRQRNTDYFAACYEKFIKKIPVEPNTVLFLSERLPEKGGNLQRVMELCEQDEDIQISKFIVTRTVDALSKKELKDCARLCAQAQVIILEDFYPQLHSLKIRKQTKVVQLWHACGAFKTFGLTRMGKPGGAPQSSMNHRNYDLATVSSDVICDIYAEAFGLTPSKVKALGVPRTDVLFDEEYKERKRAELYEKYPQMKGKKVVLFAPTFRGDGNKDAHYPEDAFDVNAFLKEQPEDTFCIVKHHPFVHQDIFIDEMYKDCALDLTGQDHINDLMLISDLLITDYSSSVFEAAILDLPMLFYAFDKKEYIESRDFYCDYDSFAPGHIESDFMSLAQRAAHILAGNPDPDAIEICEKKLQFRHDFLSALDGHSTERIKEYIKKSYLQ